MLVRKDWPFLFLLLCLGLILNVVLFFLTWKNLLDTNSIKTRSGENEREKEVQEFICFWKLGWLEWIIANAKHQSGATGFEGLQPFQHNILWDQWSYLHITESYTPLSCGALYFLDLVWVKHGNVHILVGLLMFSRKDCLPFEISAFIRIEVFKRGFHYISKIFFLNCKASKNIWLFFFFWDVSGENQK